MSNSIFLSPQTLLVGGKITALIHIERDTIHQFVAWAAGYGPVTIIDCGCSFNATRLLELIHLEHIYFTEPMDNIDILRPFTAYQYTASITRLVGQLPPPGSPIVVMSALAQLYDENVQLGEAMRLLKTILADVCQLRQNSPIILSITPPPPNMQERICLFRALIDVADQTIAPDVTTKHSSTQQLELF